MKKYKVKTELVFWRNKRGSYDGYVVLNSQHLKHSLGFMNLPKEGALKKFKDDVGWLCEELRKK